MPFERLRDRQDFRGGRDVRATCIRLAVDFHLLRHIVHLGLGWIARAPLFDAKVLLGIHAHEDAEFAVRLAGRLQELEDGTGLTVAPDQELRPILQLLERIDNWAQYVGVVYSVLKPALIDAWESHYIQADPLLDEPTGRLLADLMRVTSQHISGGMILVECLNEVHGEEMRLLHEATTRIRPDLFRLMQGGGGAVPAQRHEPFTPRVFPPLSRMSRGSLASPHGHEAQPAAPADALHSSLTRRIGEEMEIAEVLAECAHGHPEQPGSFHRALSRLAWDRVRHARTLEKVLHRAGGVLDFAACDPAISSRLLPLPLSGRLEGVASHVRAVAGHDHALLIEAAQRETLPPAMLQGFLAADDQHLLHTLAFWSEYIHGEEATKGR